MQRRRSFDDFSEEEQLEQYLEGINRYIANKKEHMFSASGLDYAIASTVRMMSFCQKTAKIVLENKDIDEHPLNDKKCMDAFHSMTARNVKADFVIINNNLYQDDLNEKISEFYAGRKDMVTVGTIEPSVAKDLSKNLEKPNKWYHPDYNYSYILFDDNFFIKIRKNSSSVGMNVKDFNRDYSRLFDAYQNKSRPWQMKL